MTDFTYAKVIAHSQGYDQLPVVTFEISFPRVILAEFNTHRVISKNTSSSRAIPVKRIIERIRNKPYFPFFWGKNKSGMSADEECILPVTNPFSGVPMSREEAWQSIIDTNIAWAEAFSDAGYHKQIVNRLIENFGYVTMVATSVHWANFFTLRDHKAAQPEIQSLAKKMKEALANSKPKFLKEGEWHLPYVTDDEKAFYKLEEQILLSTARCASTSYLTVDGFALDINKAGDIWEKLFAEIPIHASPAEHQCTPDHYVTTYGEEGWSHPELHGNLTGYKQNRHFIANNTIEDVYVPYDN